MESKLQNSILIWAGNSSLDPTILPGNPYNMKKEKDEILESNFDKLLLKTLNEVHYWQKLSGVVTIQNNITKLLEKKDHLRQLWENVMMVVWEYNVIINSISDNDWPLFAEHIQELDSAIRPGLERLNWLSNIESGFLPNAREKCWQLFKRVKDF